MQSAIGIEQLKKLPTFILNRHANQERFKEYCLSQRWYYQHEPIGGYSSSFGCAFFTEEIEDVKRDFEDRGIDYRPIMSGNFTKSKSIDYYVHEIFDNLNNADWVERNGIFIGNHHYPIDWSFLD